MSSTDRDGRAGSDDVNKLTFEFVFSFSPHIKPQAALPKAMDSLGIVRGVD